MRAVRNTEAGVAVVDIDEPTGEGTLLTVAASSICGRSHAPKWGSASACMNPR